MSSVWITGGGSGIGKALALSFARDNWRVIISGREQKKLDRVCELSPNIINMVCDIRDLGAVKHCVETIGAPDLAILNAGEYNPGPTVKSSIDDFRGIMEVNYFGTLNCIKTLLSVFKSRRGHICVVASLAGYRGLPNSSGYGPSKAALISVCESLHSELQSSAVTIQLINPGFVRSRLTAQNDFTMPFLIEPEEAAAEIRKGIKKKKFEIAFPGPFVRRMKILRVLPYWLYFRLMRMISK